MMNGRPSALATLNNNTITSGAGVAGPGEPETPALPEEEAALLAKLEEANR